MGMGQRIKQSAKQKGISLRKLADNVGISYNTLYSITKRDSNNISGATVKKIANALGVPDDFLCFGCEVDRDYELICATLESAGFKIEPSGRSNGEGATSNTYYITRVGSYDTKDSKECEEIEYSRLVDVVQKILEDAENNKNVYIRKRLEAELFFS